MDLLIAAILLAGAFISLYFEIRRLRKSGLSAEKIYPTAIVSTIMLVVALLFILLGRQILDPFGHPYIGIALGGLTAAVIAPILRKALSKAFDLNGVKAR
jgi:ABC-type Co2+ transport system permease subunit